MEDLHQKWPHRWMTKKVKVHNSSIHGFGVVATEPIDRNEIVIVVGGIIVPKSEILEYRRIIHHIGIQIHDDFWIVPSNKKETTELGFPNHSCDPNLGFDGSVCYVTVKDVKTGEELVVDYAFMESDFEPFECKCGSENCRKFITAKDWKIKELQEKYGKYFSPYLKKKFEQKD